MSQSNALVVVTRPLAQADELAQNIAALGREPVVFPLLEIHPLADTAPLRLALADLTDYALVAFVSPNAIDAVFAMLPDWPKAVPIAIMGQGSRKALARHGVNNADATIFSPRNAQRTDSETLFEALDIATLRGCKVLIVRGESGRELLADRLREQGVEVIQIAAYRRCAPEFTAIREQQLERLLMLKNDWIVTSSEALRILMKMVAQLRDTNSVVKMQQQRLIVPHVRIVETAQTEGFSEILLTGSGDAALLEALKLSV